LKVYLEVVERTGSLAADKARAAQRMAQLRAGLEQFLAAT
jgi:hypothetical protein